MRHVVYRSKEGPYIEKSAGGKKYHLIVPARCWWWGAEDDNYPVIVGVSKDKNYLKKKLKKVLTQQ